MIKWTSKIQENLLDNAIVTYKYRDGIHAMTEIKANDGYVLSDTDDLSLCNKDEEEVIRSYYKLMYLPISRNLKDINAIPETDIIIDKEV